MVWVSVPHELLLVFATVIEQWKLFYLFSSIIIIMLEMYKLAHTLPVSAALCTGVFPAESLASSLAPYFAST